MLLLAAHLECCLRALDAAKLHQASRATGMQV